MLETTGLAVNWPVVANLSVSCQNTNNLAPLIFRMKVLAAKKLNFQPWSWQFWNWFSAGEIFPALGKIGRVSEMVCFHRVSWFEFKSQSKEAISVHQQLMVVIGLVSSLASPLIFCPRDVLLQKTNYTENWAKAIFLLRTCSLCRAVPSGKNKHGLVCVLKHRPPETLPYKDWDSLAVPFSLTLL